MFEVRQVLICKRAWSGWQGEHCLFSVTTRRIRPPLHVEALTWLHFHELSALDLERLLHGGVVDWGLAATSERG